MINSLTNTYEIQSNYIYGESWSFSKEFVILHNNEKNKVQNDRVWGKDRLTQWPLLKSDVSLGFSILTHYLWTKDQAQRGYFS